MELITTPRSALESIAPELLLEVSGGCCRKRRCCAQPPAPPAPPAPPSPPSPPILMAGQPQGQTSDSGVQVINSVSINGRQVA